MDALVAWVDEPWAMIVNAPFVISGCTERTIIFDSCFRMEVPNGTLCIASCDHWKDVAFGGLEQAIALRGWNVANEAAVP